MLSLLLQFLWDLLQVFCLLPQLSSHLWRLHWSQVHRGKQSQSTQSPPTDIKVVQTATAISIYHHSMNWYQQIRCFFANQVSLQNTSPLFDLPLELREKVYDHLACNLVLLPLLGLSESRISRKFGNSHPLIFRAPACDSLRQVNRQVCDEINTIEARNMPKVLFVINKASLEHLFHLQTPYFRPGGLQHTYQNSQINVVIDSNLLRRRCSGIKELVVDITKDNWGRFTNNYNKDWKPLHFYLSMFPALRLLTVKGTASLYPHESVFNDDEWQRRSGRIVDTRDMRSKVHFGRVFYISQFLFADDAWQVQDETYDRSMGGTTHNLDVLRPENVEREAERAMTWVFEKV